MAITVQQIFDRVGVLLHDDDSTRWETSERLMWINDGCRDIVAVRPDAYTVNYTIQLVAGTRQSIPSDGMVFVRGVRNMSGGVIPGKAVRSTDVLQLDLHDPDWHTATATSEVTTVGPDPSIPTQFYVYPPADGSGYLEIAFSKVPTEVTSVSDNIPLNDKFATSLMHYVIYRAMSKDAEYAPNAEIAATHLKLFTDSVSAIK